jgi:hypothetical protein
MAPQFVASLPERRVPVRDTGRLQEAGIGAMDLRFSEVGVVTGGTPGAPVTLTLHVAVASTPIAVGGVVWDDHFAKAKMYVRAIDNNGGFVGVEREALNAQVLDPEPSRPLMALAGVTVLGALARRRGIRTDVVYAPASVRLRA